MEMEEKRIVSIDPDDADPGVVYIEDVLRSQQMTPREETKVYTFNPCYYLIPQIMTTLTYHLKYPMGHIAAACMDVGLTSFMRWHEEQVAVIEEVRIDIIKNGGNWHDKEFVGNRIRADFHTSKMTRWGVRAGETAMDKCDRVALIAGLSITHLRQVVMLSGMVQSRLVTGDDQWKMMEVIKWFGGVLTEKAEFAKRLKCERKAGVGVKKVRRPWMDDPWVMLLEKRSVSNTPL